MRKRIMYLVYNDDETIECCSRSDAYREYLQLKETSSTKVCCDRVVFEYEGVLDTSCCYYYIEEPDIWAARKEN